MTKPKVGFFPNHAHLFSVLLNEPATAPWIYNHYILLRGWSHHNEAKYGTPWDCSVDFYDPFHWSACPWIYYQRISRELVGDGWPSIIEFLRDCLRNGYYVYLSCDMYYIPVSRSYNKRHVVHEPFIFGIDDMTQIVYMADFFRDRYEYSECRISEFRSGYDAVIFSEQKDTRDGVHLISYSSSRRSGLQDVHYEFNSPLMRAFVEDYLNSANSTQSYFSMTQVLDFQKIIDCEVHYGLGIYSLLRAQLDLWNEHGQKIDHKPFTAIRGHKVLMCDRIDFLDRTGRIEHAGSVKDTFRSLCEQSEILLRSVLRYRRSRDSRILHRIALRLDEFARTDRIAFEELLRNLR